MQQTEKFDLWCVVELMGHQQIAGKCTEQSIAGVNMLRVDVPETKKQPAFTKFYGGTAIYAINPVDEATAVAKINALNISPIQVWNIQAFVDKQSAALRELPSLTDKISSVDEDDYPDFDDNDNPI